MALHNFVKISDRIIIIIKYLHNICFDLKYLIKENSFRTLSGNEVHRLTAQ